MLYATDPGTQLTTWDLAQQAVTFAATLLVIGTTVAGLLWRWPGKKIRERRARERAAHEEARRAAIADEVEKVVKPIREQVGAIHHTTHVNSGVSPTPTLKDNLHDIAQQIRNQTTAIGAIAVGQANLSSRMDRHMRDEHGVDPDDEPEQT